MEQKGSESLLELETVVKELELFILVEKQKILIAKQVAVDLVVLTPAIITLVFAN